MWLKSVAGCDPHHGAMVPVCTFATRLSQLHHQLLFCALCSLPHNRQQCRSKGLFLCPLPSGGSGRPSQSCCKSSTAVKKQSPHQSSGTSVLSLAPNSTPSLSVLPKDFLALDTSHTHCRPTALSTMEVQCE